MGAKGKKTTTAKQLSASRGGKKKKGATGPAGKAKGKKKNSNQKGEYTGLNSQLPRRVLEKSIMIFTPFAHHSSVTIESAKQLRIKE